MMQAMNNTAYAGYNTTYVAYNTPKKVNPIIEFFSRERTPHDPWADAVRAASKAPTPVAAPVAMPVAAPVAAPVAKPVVAPVAAKVAAASTTTMQALSAFSYSLSAPVAPAAQWL